MMTPNEFVRTMTLLLDEKYVPILKEYLRQEVAQQVSEYVRRELRDLDQKVQRAVEEEFDRRNPASTRTTRLYKNDVQE